MKKFLLVGNPNTGKTTLFNSLTKSNEHVGNWHGVTVSEKEKICKLKSGEEILIVDLPGLYSLTPLSFEEEVASDYIYENECPIINICDINNLQRNLYLTLQLLEAKREVILFVNTMKKNEKKEKINNIKNILNKLNISFFIGNADSKKDVEKFKEKLTKKFNKINLKYEKNINKIFNIKLNEIIDKNIDKKNASYAYIRAVEGDKLFLKKYAKIDEKIIDKNISFINLEKIVNLRQHFLKELFIDKNNEIYGKSKLDNILLNKYFCIPIFFIIIFIIFYLTFFSFGAWLSSLIRTFVQDVVGANLISFLKNFITVPWVIDLFEVGIIGGVGSLLAFLPQILLLFFFLSIIEDSGYLSRIAFLFEDTFSKVGLSGKSFYTLLMAFGCSTTAALTARNMEDKNAKIKTALLSPYMSCSAKLPIYAVVGGAFFGKTNPLVVFCLYILGVFLALIVSLVLEKTKLKSKEQSFILEFPKYRFPSPKRILIVIFQNIKSFLVRVGSLLISINVIIWILQSFTFDFKFIKTSGGVCMLESFGGIFAPIFLPLGFGSWGAVSALLAGLIAKEVIVSSIAMFNGINMEAGDANKQIMSSLAVASSAVCFTNASALSFMTFCLLYSPCLATISVLRKEIGKKWTLIAIAIHLVVAYITSFVVYRFALFFEKFNFFVFAAVFLSLAIILLSVVNVVRKIKTGKSCSNCDTCGKCK